MQQHRATLSPIVPSPRLVLFDLDDTLCDYAGARVVRLRKAFSLALESQDSMFSIDLDELIAESLAIHPHGTDHFEDLFRRHGIVDKRAAEIAKAWYRQNRFYCLSLFADATETLDAVRRLLPRRTIGMITNGPTDVQRAKIDMFGLESKVDFILISEEFGVGKPDPSIFAEALKLGSANNREAVYIGDSPEYDIAGARSAGIRSIWVNRSGGSWAEDHLPPDHEARDLADVRALLGVAAVNSQLNRKSPLDSRC
jgi:HAD superfamily hydrolase (TIGR01549 family)